jgi:hypothetical protein
MIVGYHVVFGAYGFWLPNDPRGSWSVFVGSWELFRYGPATKTSETWSQARQPHDIRLRLAAEAGPLADGGLSIIHPTQPSAGV